MGIFIKRATSITQEVRSGELINMFLTVNTQDTMIILNKENTDWLEVPSTDMFILSATSGSKKPY
jgi:hypothetical protein